MTLDIAKYGSSKDLVLRWFHDKGQGEINRTISMMGSVTQVPCIVIAYWLGAETNWSADSVEAIKKLQDFYGYDSIENKPDGSPI